MPAHYIQLHTLRHVCQLAGMPEARLQIPVALSRPEPQPGGTIVLLERSPSC